MRYDKQEFVDEAIRLDDNEYIDCTFTNCRFSYGGGDFNIERINFDTLEFTVDGPAARTIQLLQALCQGEAGRRAVIGLLQSGAAPPPTVS